MSAAVGATSPADFHTAAAVEAVENRHPWLGGAVGVQVEALLDAAARGSLPGTTSDALVRWCDAKLIPHALAEEQAMYPGAHENPRARLLVEAMLAEYLDLVALVDAVRKATGPVRAGANAQALRSLSEPHVGQENEQVLPLLAESSQVSLAAILDGLHEPPGGGQGHSEYAEAAAECGCGGECGCGHQHQSDLDAPWEDCAR